MVEPMPQATPLGNKLRELRKQRRWTLDELAIKIDSSKSHLSSIETGRTRDPSVSVLQKLAGAFGVSYDFLLDPELLAEAPEDREFIGRYLRLDPTQKAKVRAVAKHFKGATP